MRGGKKLFQLPMKAKITTLASAGLESGRIISHKMRHEEAPSNRAASSSSCGIFIKNWRSRKIKNGQPNQAGIVNGSHESFHFNREKSTYCGMSVTSLG